MNIAEKFYNYIIKLLNSDEIIDEDTKRKKHILNVLSLSMLSFYIFLLIISIYSIYAVKSGYSGTPTLILFLFFIITLLALIFSKQNKVYLSSYILLSLIYFCILYGSVHWGADLPTVLISLFITVLMTGILINSKAGLICAIILSVHLSVFNYIERLNLLNVDTEWKKYSFNQDDVIEYSLLLIFASIFSWLSNNQLEKSLHRSRNAEKKLKEERDNLDIEVANRTQEIKKLQIDKINSMYRLVEFGRISSGLFHDIMTPLTDININLQMLKIEEAKETIGAIIPSIKKIDNLIHQSKKHMRIDSENTIFCIKEEILSVIDILESKSKRSHVKISLSKRNTDIKINNSQTLFSHIIMNLVSNGIDSYEEMNWEEDGNKKQNRMVVISTKYNLGNLYIKVNDNGCGIEKDMTEKIFQPFYTTKKDQGCGIGLSATKHILEKYFNGQIQVRSKLGKGTSFTITIPVLNKF